MEHSSADCPHETELLLWLLGEFAETYEGSVRNHSHTCPLCSEKIARLADSIVGLQAHHNAAVQPSSACLDEAQLAAWVDGLLQDQAKEAALAHLADCDRCRRAASVLATTLLSEPVAGALSEIEAESASRRRPAVGRQSSSATITRWLGPAVAVAAAATVAGLLLLRPADTDSLIEPPHRESPAGLKVAPQPEAPVGAIGAVRGFTWSPVSGADLYRVTVFDEQGMVIWNVEVRETQVALADETVLEPGERYFWTVAARVGWERWVSSELVGFSISRP